MPNPRRLKPTTPAPAETATGSTRTTTRRTQPANTEPDTTDPQPARAYTGPGSHHQQPPTAPTKRRK